MKALEITGLEKTYKNGFQALKGIDLEVEEGEFFALLGPNGAGKSTTIGIIASLVTKNAGSVKIFGLETEKHLSDAKSYLGIVPQEINFSMFETCLNIVVNQAGYYGISKKIARRQAEKYLTRLDLWDRRNEISRNLSGGLKRRLMIARALLHEPRLLILDEPTAGVDVELRRSMWGFLREINTRGTTIVLTTHYLEEAESLCRKVAIIDRGVIVENSSMKEVLTKLNAETFVLDLENPVGKLPDKTGFGLRRIDPLTLEVDVNKEQNANALFDTLSAHGIVVRSMRNKTNRLEELFMRLLEGEGSYYRREPGEGGPWEDAPEK